jgi:hypothetical protein
MDDVTIQQYKKWSCQDENIWTNVVVLIEFLIDKIEVPKYNYNLNSLKEIYIFSTLVCN